MSCHTIQYNTMQCNTIQYNTYIQRDRQTDRQTDRHNTHTERHTETDRQAGRQADRHAYIHTITFLDNPSWWAAAALTEKQKTTGFYVKQTTALLPIFRVSSIPLKCLTNGSWSGSLNCLKMGSRNCSLKCLRNWFPKWELNCLKIDPQTDFMET